jgi:hypothetical protein
MSDESPWNRAQEEWDRKRPEFIDRLETERRERDARHDALFKNNPPPSYDSTPQSHSTIAVLTRVGTAIALLSLAAKFFKFEFPITSIQGLPVWEWGLGIGIVIALVGWFPRLAAMMLTLCGLAFVGFAACTRDNGFDLAAVPNGNWVVAVFLLVVAGGLSRWAK